MDPEKVEAVMSWERSKSVFLKEVKFDWDDQCEDAFQELKRRLNTTPILIVPDRGQGYTVYCDTSRAGLGCIFMQSGRAVA